MSKKTLNGIASAPEDTQRKLSSADRVGRVFIALGHGMRRCLICDDVFNPHGAVRHSVEICCASASVSLLHPISLE
jgi:hypothetical protein